MSWSLNIGSVAGTAVRVHVTFLLFLVWIFGVFELPLFPPVIRYNDGGLFVVLKSPYECIGKCKDAMLTS